MLHICWVSVAINDGRIWLSTAAQHTAHSRRQPDTHTSCAQCFFSNTEVGLSLWSHRLAYTTGGNGTWRNLSHVTVTIQSAFAQNGRPVKIRLAACTYARLVMPIYTHTQNVIIRGNPGLYLVSIHQRWRHLSDGHPPDNSLLQNLSTLKGWKAELA